MRPSSSEVNEDNRTSEGQDFRKGSWERMKSRVIKEEMPNQNVNLWGDEMDIKDEEMFNDDVDFLKGAWERMKNRVIKEEMPNQNVMPSLGDEPHFENEDVDETINCSNDNEIKEENREEDGEKISSETIEWGQRRRSSRIMSKPVTFTESESPDYSDDDYEPMAKKLKAKSANMKNKRISGAVEKKGGLASSKGIPKQMKCPECEYQTTSACSFTSHLRYVHSTTLVLAGLALRCDCGVETFSEKHKYRDKCDIANFTVVRKRDGPIQTFNDEKTTPQCILCEVYPKTASGYMQHLFNYHNTTLRVNGIYLLCSCGAQCRYSHSKTKHTKECNRREYTLHKIADK